MTFCPIETRHSEINGFKKKKKQTLFAVVVKTTVIVR